MMKQIHTVVYVTGLSDNSGDKNVEWQKQAIRLWQIFGVKTILFQMSWADKKPFQQKLDRLLKLIDELDECGHKISLVGVSAGASAALAAFAQRKRTVSGVVFICGKLARPEGVQKSYFIKNPAFQTAMARLKSYEAKLNTSDRQKILSIRPLYDQTVAVRDTKISGVHHRIIPTLFHAPSIALGITIFSPIVIFFLKKRAKIGL